MSLTQVDLDHLAHLIERVCDADPDAIKSTLAQRAKADMGWDAARITEEEHQVQGYDVRVGEHLSAKEWLCSICCSGEELSCQHLLITLLFVNPDISPEAVLSGGAYATGAPAWAGLPPALRSLLTSCEARVVAALEERMRLPVIACSEDGRITASAGFHAAFGAPEVLIDSVPPEVAREHIRTLARMLEQNPHFVDDGTLHERFCAFRTDTGEVALGPMECRALTPGAKARFMNVAAARCEESGDPDFRAVQVVLCTSDGRLPWDTDKHSNQRMWWRDTPEDSDDES